MYLVNANGTRKAAGLVWGVSLTHVWFTHVTYVLGDLEVVLYTG